MKFGSPAINFIYHLGVHCTDEDMLIRSLLKDGNALAERKIIVPRPRTYRKLIAEVTGTHRGEPLPEQDQTDLFDKILKGYPAERVILSDRNFLGQPQDVFQNKALYGNIQERSIWLRYLFPENPCEFYLAIRNPATFLPEALKLPGVTDFQSFTGGADPRQIRWRDVIAALQEANPGCPITVWCNEDTPLIWPTLLHEIADSDPATELSGENDILTTIMSEDGLSRMRSYMASHPPNSEIQRRRVVSAFLDKYAIEDALEEEIDLPGWSPELVDEISENYDEDVYQIERMSGVHFIAT